MRRKIRDPRRAKWMARRNRVVRSVRGSGRVELVVYRSSKHIYAQLIDPVDGRTVGGVSSRSPKVAGDLGSTGNVEAARRVGAAIANLAREKDIDRVVFNRNGFLYHGRVKALADAAREAGLQF